MSNKQRKDRTTQTMLVCVILATLMLLSPAVNVASALDPGPARYGGTLIISEDEGVRWDPPNYLTCDYEPQTMIYSKLVKQAFATGEYLPDLAYNWTFSADCKTWTFYLYNNVTWHDGVNFTSADVQFSFMDMLDKNGVQAPQFRHVLSIDTPDDYTAVFHLNKSDGVFTAKMAPLTAPVILAKHLYENAGDPRTNPWNKKPIGTGPFKWSNESTTDYSVIVANLNYFRGRPYLDKIITRFIPNHSTWSVAMQTGEIDAGYQPPTPTEAREWGSNPAFKVWYPKMDSMGHLDFNLTVPPFNDVRVRKAVQMAINVSEYIHILYFDKTVPMQTPLFSIPAWVPSTDPAAQVPGYDPAAAEQLLDAAGYPKGLDGVRFTTNYWTWTLQNERDKSEVIGNMLKKVGIMLNIFYLDSPTYYSKILTEKNWDGMTSSTGYTGWDPDGMRLFLGKGGPRNCNNYYNARVEELFDLGASSADPAVRKPYYDEMQKILIADQPRVFLDFLIKLEANRAEFHDFYWDQSPGGAGTLTGHKQLNLVWWDGGTLPETSTGDWVPRVSALESNITTLTGQISNLSGQLTTMTIVAAAGVMVAVAAIALVFFRKPKK